MFWKLGLDVGIICYSFPNLNFPFLIVIQYHHGDLFWIKARAPEEVFTDFGDINSAACHIQVCRLLFIRISNVLPRETHL